MNGGYVTVKCCRCSSTIQLVIGAIRSDLFLCPVCHEGEIECRVQRLGDPRCRIIGNGLQDLGQYIAKPVRLSMN